MSTSSAVLASPETTLLDRVRSWAAHDPDERTRGELEQLIFAATSGEADARRSSLADLAERFAGPLEFGTAGLRGVLGAGESRMNLAVVLRTAHGLAAHLLADRPEAARSAGVVVGHDARRQSRELAEATAEVLAAAGVRVHLSARECPTPLVAFTAKAKRAAAAVVVTASHNPPEYNGFKVYGAAWAQIVEPEDRLIADRIAAAPFADEVTRLELSRARDAGLVTDLAEADDEAYVAALLASVKRPSGVPRAFPIGYTPLHGVGLPLLRATLERAGFASLVVTPEQAEPDGAFPTVAFPNPEEPGALTLAMRAAEQGGADLLVANDPDADRLAVAVRRGAEWTQLTGNQVGVLLGAFLLSEAEVAHPLVVTTVVSSPMLRAVAEGHGARCAETLTGFKWITHAARTLSEAEGLSFVFGYEEALGYAVGDAVRDKDGIGAALALCELAARCRLEGRDLLAELERLYRRFGLFASRQVSLSRKGVEGAKQIAAWVDRLREAPPRSLGGLRVLATVDRGRLVRHEAGAATPIVGPSSNVFTLELEGGSRVVARPSGTEPKMKVYLDVREPLGGGEALSAAQARADARMAAVWGELAGLFGVPA